MKYATKTQTTYNKIVTLMFVLLMAFVVPTPNAVVVEAGSTSSGGGSSSSSGNDSPGSRTSRAGDRGVLSSSSRFDNRNNNATHSVSNSISAARQQGRSYANSLGRNRSVKVYALRNQSTGRIDGYVSVSKPRATFSNNNNNNDNDNDNSGTPGTPGTPGGPGGPAITPTPDVACSASNYCGVTGAGIILGDNTCSATAPSNSICTNAAFPENALTVSPSLVRVDDQVTVTYNVGDYNYPPNCTLSGPQPVGTRILTTKSGSLSVTALAAHIYRLECGTENTTTRINIVGTVQEI